MIDFREIKDSEIFEDLIAALLRRTEGVVDVQKTGRGSDLEIDLRVKARSRDPLRQRDRDTTAIVQCKHLAMSGKSVRKSDIRPADALIAHNADVYLLVTSTRVGAFYQEIMRLIDIDPRNRGQSAGSWDCDYLERQLLKQENEDLLRKFFPKSFKRVMRQAIKSRQTFASVRKALPQDMRLDLPEDIRVVDSDDQENMEMRKIYLITGVLGSENIRTGKIQSHARQLGIVIETSVDVAVDNLLTLEKTAQHEKYLRKADAVFAWVTKQSSKEPNVWIEIEKARGCGKLKAVFIDEAVYALPLMGEYPCVLLRKSFERSVADFLGFFKTVSQTWGSEGYRWFWFGLAILMTQFKLPPPSKAAIAIEIAA